jgi:type III pantothenate kinase
MLLAIEQGNTNTLFAVHDGQEWIAQWRSATESTRTADEYAVWLSQLLGMAGLELGVFTGCIVSSVVPQSIFNLRNLARRYLHVEPLVIGENVDLGIEIRIEKPSEAGADRLVNAIGAHIVYPGDLIVIDSGTATTFDVIAADGAMEGCAIAPGINLSMEALHQAAAKLHPAPARQHRHRQGYRRGHAIRSLLGLYRADRRLGRAHQGRVGQADVGDRHRRRRLAVPRRDHGH